MLEKFVFINKNNGSKTDTYISQFDITTSKLNTYFPDIVFINNTNSI